MDIVDEIDGYQLEINNVAYSAFKLPTYKWILRIGDFSIYVMKGKEPNWFYRWAQQVCLGIHWEKISEDH